MRGRQIQWAAVFLAAISLAPSLAAAADFAGNFEGERLSIVIAPDHDAYSGEIRFGDKRFPFTAREDADHLTGSFTTQGGRFNFTAALTDGGLSLVTGKTTYELRRAASKSAAPVNPINPLEVATTPAPATAPADADPLASYTVVNETTAGKALTRQIPSATTIRAALQATFPGLARYFGARPEILGAYEDQKDQRSAGVAFSAQLNGQAVTGLVSLKIDEQGASILVVYCKADAPKAEWAKLIAKPVKAGKGNAAKDDAAALAAAAAAVPLKTYSFPDGTGTIGVAEGWTTSAQTLAGATLKGPGDQQVLIGAGAEVVTPNNWMVQQQRQMALNARRWGGPPPPPIKMLIAPWSPDPAEALKNLIPALNVVNEASGLPVSRLDKIVQTWKLPALTTNGTAGLVLCDVTQTLQGRSTQYRALIQLEVYPLAADSWAYYSTMLKAPRETFQQDLPVMLAQSQSVKENAAVIQQKTREAIDAQNRQFAAMQAANKEVQAAFDARNKAWERNELTNLRTNANFDEVIRGYRTVEDTTTGNRTSVDLGNVHQVVENLNYYDPGRYKEIPLRDEMYPLPGN